MPMAFCSSMAALEDHRCFTIKPTSHRGAEREIPGRVLECASKAAGGNRSAPESAPEG